MDNHQQKIQEGIDLLDNIDEIYDEKKWRNNLEKVVEILKVDPSDLDKNEKFNLI